jgi:hypothetical protein
MVTAVDPDLNILELEFDVLESELPDAGLDGNEEYRRLQKRASELAPRLRESVDDFEQRVATHREIDRGR